MKRLTQPVLMAGLVADDPLAQRRLLEASIVLTRQEIRVFHERGMAAPDVLWVRLKCTILQQSMVRERRLRSLSLKYRAWRMALPLIVCVHLRSDAPNRMKS